MLIAVERQMGKIAFAMTVDMIFTTTNDPTEDSESESGTWGVSSGTSTTVGGYCTGDGG
jgi:hypothetical protein